MTRLRLDFYEKFRGRGADSEEHEISAIVDGNVQLTEFSLRQQRIY